MFAISIIIWHERYHEIMLCEIFVSASNTKEALKAIMFNMYKCLLFIELVTWNKYSNITNFILLILTATRKKLQPLLYIFCAVQSATEIKLLATLFHLIIIQKNKKIIFATCSKDIEVFCKWKK